MGLNILRYVLILLFLGPSIRFLDPYLCHSPKKEALKTKNVLKFILF